jgi:putative copper export protein/methionine-rich copper-binding protein CopC
MTVLRRACNRGATVLVAAAAAVLLAGSPASAHSELERSDPPDGGAVAIGRSTLSLWFTEAVSPGASRFDLRASDGAPVAATVSAAGSGGGSFVQLATPPLAKADYVLDWRVLSLDDGHPSSGSLRFGVGTRPPAVPSTRGGLPDVPWLLLRWLDLSALLLTIGGLTVAGRVLAAAGPAGEGARRRARLIAVTASGVAVVTGALTLLLSTRPGGGPVQVWLEATVAGLTQTPWGRLWLVREALLVVAAAALAPWARSRTPSAAARRTAVVAVAAVLIVESWSGHASALPGRPGVAVLASAAHLAAAGVWAGGLTVLAVCLLPTTRGGRRDRDVLVAPVWRAYGPMAAAATAVLVASGLYASGRHLPALDAVSSTVYGGAVAAKVVLAAAALALAGINTLLVNPRLSAAVGRATGRPAGWTPVPRRRFAALVAVEAAVLMVAVGTGALLTSVPTARETARASTASAPQSTAVDGLFVTFEQVPAGPGRSRVIVRARSTIRPAPGPVSGVQVRLGGPDGAATTVALEPVEPGRYEAPAVAPTPGDWTAAVVVRREGAPDAVARVSWTVADAVAGGASRLEVVTTALAVLMLVLTAGAVGALRRRREPTAPSTPRLVDHAGRHR